jgi:N-acetylglucosamine-6-phosphate deacetylase
VLVTDAMPTVGADAKSFNLQGPSISVEDGVCVDEVGVLSGSDLDHVDRGGPRKGGRV